MASLSPKRLVSVVLASAICLLLLYQLAEHTFHAPSNIRNPFSTQHAGHAQEIRRAISTESKYFIDHPLPDTAFGERGARTEKLTKWLQQAAELAPDLDEKEHDELIQEIEDAIVSIYPSVKNPVNKESTLR